MSTETDRPVGAPTPAQVAALIARVAAGSGPPGELFAVTEALVGAGLLDDDEAYGELREPLIALLAELVGEGAVEGVRDDALLALAAMDAAKATTLCYKLFARSPARPDGPAGRWLERLSGVSDPTIEALVAQLSRVDNLRAVLTSRALAERGADALPALHSALAALPVPAVPDSPDWWAGETAKYRIMKALQWLGPVAAPTGPLLLALLADEGGYRDTRHQAKMTLQAIGHVPTTDVTLGSTGGKDDGDRDRGGGAQRPREQP